MLAVKFTTYTSSTLSNVDIANILANNFGKDNGYLRNFLAQKISSGKLHPNFGLMSTRNDITYLSAWASEEDYDQFIAEIDSDPVLQTIYKSIQENGVVRTVTSSVASKEEYEELFKINADNIL